MPAKAYRRRPADRRGLMWQGFVELIRATIFAGAHLLNGSLGASSIVISTLVRLALLPLTIRSARLARAHHARLAAIKSQLDHLNKRYASDPGQLLARTQALHREHGIGMLPKGSVVSAAV